MRSLVLRLRQGCDIGAVIASTDFKRELNYGKENIGCYLWK